MACWIGFVNPLDKGFIRYRPAWPGGIVLVVCFSRPVIPPIVFHAADVVADVGEGDELGAVLRLVKAIDDAIALVEVPPRSIPRRNGAIGQTKAALTSTMPSKPIGRPRITLPTVDSPKT